MPSIERRERGGRVRWRAHYRTPEGRQRNRTFDRKLDAERFLTSVSSTKLAGTFVDPARARATVGEMAARWTASKSGLEKSTQATYSAVMDDHVLPRWRDVPLAAVDHEAVQEWVAELVAAGHSPAHVRKIHLVLAGVLELAVRARRLPANPAKGVDLPKLTKSVKRYLRVEQVESLATSAGHFPVGVPRRRGDESRAQYRMAVFVLAYTGVRWSELAAARVYSLDLLRRRLHVKAAVVEVDGVLAWKLPKSHEARWVPIPAFLAADLAELIAGKRPDDLLFTAPGGGVLRNRNARRAWFDQAAVAAGVPGLTPHELRHSAASLAVSAGANVLALAKMLGHADPSVTLRIYAELFDDDLDAVGAKLDELRGSRVAPALHEGARPAGSESAGKARKPRKSGAS